MVDSLSVGRPTGSRSYHRRPSRRYTSARSPLGLPRSLQCRRQSSPAAVRRHHQHPHQPWSSSTATEGAVSAGCWSSCCWLYSAEDPAAAAPPWSPAPVAQRAPVTPSERKHTEMVMVTNVLKNSVASLQFCTHTDDTDNKNKSDINEKTFEIAVASRWSKKLVWCLRMVRRGVLFPGCGYPRRAAVHL